MKIIEIIYLAGAIGGIFGGIGGLICIFQFLNHLKVKYFNLTKYEKQILEICKKHKDIVMSFDAFGHLSVYCFYDENKKDILNGIDPGIGGFKLFSTLQTLENLGFIKEISKNKFEARFRIK